MVKQSLCVRDGRLSPRGASAGRHPRVQRGWLLVLALVGLSLACFVQCGPPASGDGLAFCNSSTDCPQGTECSMNTCIKVPGFRHDGAAVDVQPPDDRPTTDEPGVEIPPSERVPEPPPVDNTGCQSDDDCTLNTHICLQGKCVRGCREAKQCPEGQLCKASQCVGCANDGECPDKQLCDNGLCKPGDCRTSADCTGGQVCKESFCAACTQDMECDKGLCLNGVCSPDSCKDRNDCPPGLICTSNKCGNCDKHGDCERNEVCDAGACKTGDCVTRDDCSKGNVCKKNQCEKCADKSDCNSDEVCDSGSCKVGNCVDRGECSGGLICKKNVCEACADKGDCLSTEVCDGGFCKVGNCVANGDCQSEQVCKNFQCGPCTAAVDCGSGYVCANGACKVGDCLLSSDCQSGLICRNLKCEPCVVNADCPAALPICVGGVCKLNGTGLASLSGGLRWADKTYAKDCSEYKNSPAGYEPATQDAVYWILPSGASKEFKVHCNMTYQGGGWTLLMKMKGTSGTFGYYSGHWKGSYHHNGHRPDFDTIEAKLESYWRVSFKEILLQFRDPLASTKASDLRSLIIKKSASSFVSLMKGSDNQKPDTPIGRSGWEGLMSSPSLQPDCNREGFNLKGSSGDGKLLRIGIQTGDKTDCSSTDSYIGMGASYSKVYAGNWAKNNANNGDKEVEVMAYLYVRTP